MQHYAKLCGQETLKFAPYMAMANAEKGFEGGTEPKIFIYFYHPDYASTMLSTSIGTNTYLTDMEGQPYQLFINLPFGELMAEQTGTGYQSPYKFNGKLQRSENPNASGELDAETGLYYYGARYYDPQSSTWLSVDPLAEKYAGWTPYNYCVGNPVVFVDPDGMEIVDAKGIKITYDPKTGWSKNATNDVKIIHSCLMETKTGREQWEKAYTSDNKINMSIVNEKLYDTDGTPALGIAEKPQKFDAKSARYVKSGGIIKVKISLGAINESFDGKNKGLTLRRQLLQLPDMR